MCACDGAWVAEGGVGGGGRYPFNKNIVFCKTIRSMTLNCYKIIEKKTVLDRDQVIRLVCGQIWG